MRLTERIRLRFRFAANREIERLKEEIAVLKTDLASTKLEVEALKGNIKVPSKEPT